MGFWDDDDLKSNDEFVKFENPGDGVSGVIAELKKHTFEDGKSSVNVYFKEDVPNLGASQTKLKSALLEIRPAVGDELSVHLAGVQKLSGGRTMKLFKIKAVRGGEVIADINQAAESAGY